MAHMAHILADRSSAIQGFTGIPESIPLPPPCSDPAVDVSHFKDHGAHILVGTPGRIDDMMKRCTFMDFKRLEVRI